MEELKQKGKKLNTSMCGGIGVDQCKLGIQARTSKLDAVIALVLRATVTKGTWKLILNNKFKLINLLMN